jgi:hypothetical protein
MNKADQPVQARPNGTGLLILGLLSVLCLGPLTAIPGILLSDRFRPFSGTGVVGYFLCWLALALTVVLAVLYMLTRVGPR